MGNQRRGALDYGQVSELGMTGLGFRPLRVPTLEEITRIKAWLCLIRNATRDYLDFAALVDRLGDEAAARVVSGMDAYYEDQQGNTGQRVATQVARQLAEPRPGDLTQVDLHSYRNLDVRWQNWGTVADVCRRIALRVVDGLTDKAP